MKQEINYEKYIIDNIKNLSGSFSPQQIFTDWITLTALSIQNSCTFFHNDIYKEREGLYLNISRKYNSDELKILCNMTGALTLLLDEEFRDFLGEIYMKSECGNKNTGQFFTPYHLSYLTAKLCYEDLLSKDDLIEINEPSVGGGGMMIAVCQVAKEKGIDYQRKLHIVAQDLDWNGVYMTYIQLSLLGVKAIVVQGDTLREPYHTKYNERHIFRTPAEMGVLF